jgi:hypothetical protein
MIKKLFSIALVCSAFIANSQNFTATYDFAATTTVSGTTDPTPSPTVTGLTCGSFVAVGTPSLNPNAGGRFSFVGWPTGATSTINTYSTMTGSISTSEYYEVTLTPQAGYTVSLNNISFGVRRSGTGIRNYAVRTSADGYTNNLPASVGTNTNLSVVGTNEFFWNFDATSSAADQSGSAINLFGATITTATSFRFYGWNSEAATGSFSIDNVVFGGSVIAPCVPATISAITGNAPICDGQTLNLSSTVLGDAPFTYTWTGAGTIGTPNASITAVTLATSSDYTLTVENACGTATSVVTATVNALPTVSVNSEAICAGSSATLTATGTTSFYVWNTGDATPTIVVTPTTSPVTFTVTATDGNNCSADAIATVTVNALPTISVNSESICAGNSTTLTASGASTYTWSTTDVNSSIVVTPTTSIVTYTVSGTDLNNCENISFASVTVIASATISAITGNAPICDGQTLNLSSTVLGDAPFTYTWTGAGTIGTLNASSTSISGATSSDYTLTVENACGIAISVVTATVNALSTISVNSEAICAGNSATLTASGASTYTWSTTDVNSTIVVTPTLSVNQYTVMATDVNNCENMSVATVTVNALPLVALSTASVNLQCVTINSVTLDGGSPLNGVYTGNGVSAGVFSPANVGVGTYTITYTFTDANNCSNSASDNITVDGCTGIQVLKTESFTIYPNPTNGVVVINSPVFPANVNVFDVNGKLVISQNITALETKIDLSNFVNGIYQLNISTEQKSFNYKVMINK